jgi:hypothetical protein
MSYTDEEQGITASDSYLRSVDDRIAAICHGEQGEIPISTVFSKMRGVYPTVTLQRFLAAKGQKSADGNSHPTCFDTQYRPELHPLDYEWYFNAASADALSQEYCVRETICLGTPTVSARAAEHGRRVSLVDHNCLIAQRFPMLTERANLYFVGIERALSLRIEAQSVIFDAPWYLEDARFWLHVASHLVALNGIIVFSLYPPLVRPTAKSEREQILDSASQIGSVTVTEDVLSYDTPLFEQEALASAGIYDAHNWRRGDLVVIRTKRRLNRSATSRHDNAYPTGWRSFVINDQVVKIRQVASSPISQEELPVRPLADCNNFVYGAVSAADPLRHEIDLWTSRNRVARLFDVPLITELFRLLESGSTVRAAADKLLGSSNRRCEQTATIIEEILMQGKRQWLVL